MRSSSGLFDTERGFTGQIADAATGLNFYNARYMDPALGRFISPDSIVPNPANPGLFNRFTYVSNNPLKYTDPTGHEVYCICIDLSAELYGGASGFAGYIWDGDGNKGWLFGYSLSGGFSLGASADIFEFSAADTIFDLEGESVSEKACAHWWFGGCLQWTGGFALSFGVGLDVGYQRGKGESLVIPWDFEPPFPIEIEWLENMFGDAEDPTELMNDLTDRDKAEEALDRIIRTQVPGWGYGAIGAHHMEEDTYR